MFRDLRRKGNKSSSLENEKLKIWAVEILIKKRPGGGLEKAFLLILYSILL
jgi:hypothetical protein